VEQCTQVACSGLRRRDRTWRWACGVVEPALAAFAARALERRGQGLERNARLEPGRKVRLGMCTGPLVGLDGEGAPKGSVRAAPAASRAVQASRIVTTALCCRHRARELRSVAGWGYTQLRLRHNTCHAKVQPPRAMLQACLFVLWRSHRGLQALGHTDRLRWRSRGSPVAEPRAAHHVGDAVMSGR
jgi:hypothetical protein